MKINNITSTDYAGTSFQGSRKYLGSIKNKARKLFLEIKAPHNPDCEMKSGVEKSLNDNAYWEKVRLNILKIFSVFKKS